MRIIVYGVGAIGGVVATALADAGREVIGIARGAQLEAIRSGGLSLKSPERALSARFDCVASPAEIDFRPDDAILMTMKSQDTLAALHDLRAAGVTSQPIFCAQNGVANERTALRFFPNVHGVCVMMPASFVEPGRVIVSCAPKLGMFDIGRFPGGTDAADAALAEALEAAEVKCYPTENVMDRKYGKLLVNLANLVDAALGPDADRGDLPERIQDEAKAVLKAAGIAWRDVGFKDPRRSEFMRFAEVPGEKRAGSSTTQSLKRGTGSVETDYLNGEIALIAREVGLPAPLNAGLQALSVRMLQDRLTPGSFDLATLEELLAGHAAA